MITTEELRELSESTHPLHGDLVRVAKELLELRGKTWLADVSNPTPTDHAELRGLCDKWVQWVQETGEMLAAHPNDLAGRIAWNHQRLMASELRPLLAPALDELDRLRAELESAAGELRVSVRDCGPGTLCGKLLSANVLLRHANGDLLSRAVDAESERDALRSELDKRKADHMEDVGRCSATINALRAIIRYEDAGLPVPPEWLIELRQMTSKGIHI